MKNKITKLFTLLLMAAMSMGAMADNVSIPQDLGSYIVVGNSTGDDGFASYITKTNCRVDSRLGDAENSKYYTIGTTRVDTKVNFNVTASAAGNYVFGFKSGASGCSSVITVKMTKEGSETPIYTSGDVTIVNDGNWDPNITHNFYIEGVEAANYTLSFEVKSISGSYAGNFGNFFFHTTDQLAWPTSSAYMELSDGTLKNARDNNDNVINYISRSGGYIDDLLIYNDEASCREFHFNIDAFKQNSKVIITITDFATGVQEAQETVIVTNNGDYAKKLSALLSAGLKTVRFDFSDNDDVADNDYLFNFRQVYFKTISLLPLNGTNYLDLNPAGVVYDHARWNEGGEVSHIEAVGASIDNLVAYNSSEGYYRLCFNISAWKQNSTVGVTITDLATETVEIDNQILEITSNGDKEMPLHNALSVGMKKIRFVFSDNDPSSADSYLFNFKSVNMPTIEALPITGEAVLDLSQWPTSGNPRYESAHQNLGYIYHNNTAHFYVVNENSTAHYELSAGIHTNVSDANLVVTVTDVVSGNVEVDAESFDVATGNDTYPLQTFALSGAVTPGLKMITFKFTKDDEDGSPWLYNINNVSFSAAPYTRTHPHMNLNTLCFPYQIDSYTGATFYTMLYKVEEASVVNDVYLQEHVGALEAGKPYFYVPEGEELVCYYSGAREDTPAKVNGVQGFYEDLTTIPSGRYVAYNNVLTIVGTGVRMGEYRAYVDMSAVAEKDDPGAPALVPGRRLLNIGEHKTPTGVENTSAAAIYGGSQKILRNGQLFIIRDGKTYNVQGQLVK